MMINKILDIIIIALFVIALIIMQSCASMRQNQYLRNNDTEYSYQIGTGRITPGMSMREVKASWGGPSSVNDYGTTVYWHYYGMTTDYMLVFRNGKLKKWSKHY